MNTEPTPRGFKVSRWYEEAAEIMRHDPQRFLRFSPQTKRALFVYLDLKEKHQVTLPRAA